MIRNIFHKITLLILVFTFSTSMISQHDLIKFEIINIKNTNFEPIIIEPLYNNIWGAIYNAEKEQCDDTPLVTGDGSKINQHNASEHRWIAISQNMLDCEYRQALLNDSTSTSFKGKIRYGDTIWINSPHIEINGIWIVHDTKNKRYNNSIDFLQTIGDSGLYNNDPLWNGKFDEIQIYALDDAKKLRLNNNNNG